MSKEPSYIRCMKPNDAKQAGMALGRQTEHGIPVREAQKGAELKPCTILGSFWVCA